MTGGDAYDELCSYTLSLGDAQFVHQLAVDAFTAQHASERTKPIGLTFALIGLYLAVEKQYTGRAVQRVHMLIGKRKRQWPRFVVPSMRGTMTVADALAAPAGPDRDRAIHAWCASVWHAYGSSREQVIELLKQHGIG